jgi:hypothetical protein
MNRALPETRKLTKNDQTTTKWKRVAARQGPHQKLRRGGVDEDDEENQREDPLCCSEKSSSGPAARAVSHRLAAARAAAAAAAALTGRSVPALRHGKRGSGERVAAAGGVEQWRRRLWVVGRGLGLGMAVRRACCARRAWICGSLLPIAISAHRGCRRCLRRRFSPLRGRPRVVFVVSSGGVLPLLADQFRFFLQVRIDSKPPPAKRMATTSRRGVNAGSSNGPEKARNTALDNRPAKY